MIYERHTNKKERIAKTDMNYLNWIIKEANFERDVEYYILRELKRIQNKKAE